MRKSKVYPKYTIEEKNEIVKEYLEGKMGRTSILRKYDISNDSVFHHWVKQFREKGTTFDTRGRSSVGKGNFKTKLKPKEMTKEELIRYVEAVEDIKKQVVFLKRQKKNIK